MARRAQSGGRGRARPGNLLGAMRAFEAAFSRDLGEGDVDAAGRRLAEARMSAAGAAVPPADRPKVRAVLQKCQARLRVAAKVAMAGPQHPRQ